MAKILIVDDNDDFREVLRQYLERQDGEMEIHEAGSGELGLASALHERPDVVLMDLRLPQMNGIDAAERIKENAPECDVILLTMFETEEFKKDCPKGAISAFIGKSEVYDRLMPVIRRCLRSRQRFASNGVRLNGHGS
jgi:DNA-binding NarL/FixJ family response regulator